MKKVLSVLLVLGFLLSSVYANVIIFNDNPREESKVEMINNKKCLNTYKIISTNTLISQNNRFQEMTKDKISEIIKTYVKNTNRKNIILNELKNFKDLQIFYLPVSEFYIKKYYSTERPEIKKHYIIGRCSQYPPKMDRAYMVVSNGKIDVDFGSYVILKLYNLVKKEADDWNNVVIKNFISSNEIKKFTGKMKFNTHKLKEYQSQLSNELGKIDEKSPSLNILRNISVYLIKNLAKNNYDSSSESVIKRIMNLKDKMMVYQPIEANQKILVKQIIYNGTNNPTVITNDNTSVLKKQMKLKKMMVGITTNHNKILKNNIDDALNKILKYDNFKQYLTKDEFEKAKDTMIGRDLLTTIYFSNFNFRMSSKNWDHVYYITMGIATIAAAVTTAPVSGAIWGAIGVGMINHEITEWFYGRSKNNVLIKRLK